MPMSHPPYSSMLPSMPPPPPRLLPTTGEPAAAGSQHAHTTTAATNADTADLQPPQPPRDLTILEILSELLPFLGPTPLPLDLDLSNNAVLTELLAIVTERETQEDQVMRIAGSSKQVQRVDEDGDEAGDEAEEDKDVAHASVPESYPDPYRVESDVVEDAMEEGVPEVVVGASGKGKGKEREEDMDVVMDDEEVSDLRKDMAALLTAHCDVPTGADSSASTSDSGAGVGNNSGMWTPAKQRFRPGSVAKSKSKLASKSNSISSGSFSPVDWSKTSMKGGADAAAGSPQVALKLSPRATLLLSPVKALRSTPKVTTVGQSATLASNPATPSMKDTVRVQTPSFAPMSPTKGVAVGGGSTTTTPAIPPQAVVPAKSYTLPAQPEGSIAALRQEALGLVYPNSFVYGDQTGRGGLDSGSESGGERGRGDRVEMVMGADAGERMLSPESERFSDEEEDQPENVEGKKEHNGEEDGEDNMYTDEDMGVAEKRKVITEELAGTTGPSASKFVSMSSLALGTGSASTAPVFKMIDRTVSTSSAASSLSSLTSVPSTGRAGSASPSASSSASASGSRSGSTSPSRSTSASSVPPVLDLSTVKFGPPRKKAKLDVLESDLPAVSKGRSIIQLDSALPTARATSPPTSQTTPGSGTTEDEDHVQGLVLSIEASSSPVRPLANILGRVDAGIGAEEADVSVITVRAAHQSQSPPQTSSSTSSPTTSTTPTSQRAPVAASCSLPTIEVEMKDDGLSDSDDDGIEIDEAAAAPDPERQQEPESEPSNPSSPLFTSPNQPPYGDVNYQDEDFDFGSSSPTKAVVGSEMAKILKVKEELITPRPKGKTTITAIASPEYIPSTSVSPSKTRTTKADVVDVDVDSPSPPPTRSSFMRTSPAKKNLKDKGKEKQSAKKRSPSVISISSSDDEMDGKPTAAKRQTQSQAQIQRQRRPRPQPVLRKAPVKLELFDDPKMTPIIIDITTPVRPSVHAPSRARRVSSPPVSPSPVVKKPKQQVVAEGDVDVELSFSAPLSPMGALSESDQEPELDLRLDEPMQMEEGMEEEVQAEPELPEPAPELPNPASESESEEEEEQPSPSFDIKKYTARLNDADDDADIVPVKKKRKVSASMSVDVTDIGSTIGTATASGAGASGENIKPDPDDDGRSTASKQHQQQPRKRLMDLIASKNKKQSAAVTRVKKRKRSSVPESVGNGATNEEEEEEKDEYDHPPLKRAKLRTGADKGKDKPASKTGKAKDPEKKLKDAGKAKEPDIPKRYPARSPRKEKPTSVVIKTPTRRPRGQQQSKASAVEWPTVDNPNFDQFVNCDICFVWYHIGCVGVEPNDVRLLDTEIYKCPVCEAGISKEASPAKNDNAASHCAHPQCLRPQKKKKKKKSHVVVDEAEQYVVEAFVGRYRKFVGGKGLHVEYLVKWHNYDYNEATWELLENMGLANPGPLLEMFETGAADQGIDLDGGSEVVLFQEAADAGWTSDRTFNHPE